MDTQELLRAGRLDDAMGSLTEKVRADPGEAKHRVFLFQLLAVFGQWERSLTQLNVAAELDPANLLMAQVCRAALQCEALRAEVFSGKRLPVVFGEPAEWVGWMVQASQLAATGNADAARELRDRALNAAPAVPGRLNGEPFEWVMDSDSRLGPILEAVVEGRYVWVPFERLRAMEITAPADLRDLVWAPATFTWTNGGNAVGLVPTRYPGSEASPDPAIRMARRTEWTEGDGGLYLGLGQRLLATDTGEYPLLEVRRLDLGTDATPTDRASEEERG